MSLEQLSAEILTLKFYAGLTTGALCSKTVRATIKEFTYRKFKSTPGGGNNAQ